MRKQNRVFNLPDRQLANVLTISSLVSGPENQDYISQYEMLVTRIGKVRYVAGP